MKRLFYGMLCLALLAGCSKDKIEEESPVPPEDATLELSATDLVFGSGGGTQEFTISCNTDWTLTNESDWCTTDVTSGNGDRTVTVTVATSSETEDRNLNLSVAAGERTGILTVTEKHGNALIMAKDKFDLPQDGGDVAIDVKSDVEEVIIPDEYKSWITLAPDARSAQIKCYVFIILEKKGKDGRRGYIIFKSGERSDTVFIFQAPEERLILSEDTCHVSSKGGDLTVELKTRIAYDVTIPSTAASWISQITEHSFRTDRLKLHIEADSIADRSAEIVIKNRYGDETDTLYIRQTAPQSPKEDITAAFDPAFAGLLQRRGYIPDSTRIVMEDVQHIDSLNVDGTYEDWKAGKGLTSLAGIEYFESLTKLYCAYNQLAELDVTSNTLLTTLSCDDNQLTSLDVTKNTILTELYCSSNQLASLDISKNLALNKLNSSYNPLTSLDVSKNTILTYLRCEANQLTSLDVSKNPVLDILICSSNQLTSLDVSSNIALTFLVCDNNRLTSLNVSKNPTLSFLSCSKNQLTTLDVSSCVALAQFSCWANQLTSLDISQNTALIELFCYNNPGDGKSVFPVIAWFDNNNIPSDFRNDVPNWNHGDNIIFVRYQTEEDLKDITADFAPDFAKVLQEKGYIPDAFHIILADIENIKTLDVSGTEDDYKAGKGLTSLKGIEYFESLTYLYCSYNQLTSLDLNNNTALTNLYCYSNQLTSLDVSNNTALTDLSCGSNQLSSLDVSKNTALINLWFSNNPGDEKGCFTIEIWNTYENTISFTNAWECNGRKVIVRILNEELSKDVTADFDPDFAKVLEEKGYIPDASHIILGDIEYNIRTIISVLDVGGTYEDWQAGKGLTSLKGIEYFESLIVLYCFNNQLTSLDVSKNTKLTLLVCGNNQLTFLDVNKNTELTDLACDGNQLTSLDVSKNTKLTELVCGSNQLTSLDVSNNTELTGLACQINQLTSLDVSGNTALTDLACYDNQLTSLDVTKNIALTFLSCSFNPLTSLDVSKNTELTDLECVVNRLTSLDVSKNTKLTRLVCDNNQLTSLDVSKNTVLTGLFCLGNQLTSLDISKNTALEYLYCYANPGDGESLFPVKAWFDNSTIPETMKFANDFDGKSWGYGFKIISIDFRKAE